MKFRKQKPEQGRLRQPVTQANRPVISYYSSPSAASRRVDDSQTIATRGKATESSSHGSRLLRHAVLFICLIVATVCLVKVLVIAPSSRIVLSGAAPNYAQNSEAVYAQKADELIGDSLLNRTKITLDTDGIAQKMKQSFPELESVVVTVPLVGNRPVVYIAPAHAVMRLETAAGSYLLSTKGYAFAGDVPSSESASLPQLLDLTGVRPQADEPFLPVSTVEFATTVHYQLTKAGVGVESLMLPQGAPYELDVRVAGKPYIVKFNLEEDAVQQSGAAVAVIKKLGGTTPSSYIDVRVPERAYYK